MTLLLDTPFVDVRGDTLRWTLAPVVRTPLAVREVRLPTGLVVGLGVLGASHQVLVRDRDDRLLVSETVACDLVGADPLPGRARTAAYSFESGIDRFAPDDFGDRVSALVERLAQHPEAVVARFPGAPHAVTALALEPTGPGQPLTWRTWHAYPQTGELVTTTTRLDVQEVAGE